MSINVLAATCVIKTQVNQADDAPLYENRSGDEILKPGKDSGGVVGESHISQSNKNAYTENTDKRYAKTVGFEEKFRSMSFVS